MIKTTLVIGSKIHTYEFEQDKSKTRAMLEDIEWQKHKIKNVEALKERFDEKDNFYITIKKYTFTGLPTYGPFLKGHINGKGSHSTIKVRLRTNITLILFALLCILLGGLQLKIYLEAAGNEAIMDKALFMMAIAFFTALICFFLDLHLKKRLFTAFEKLLDAPTHKVD